MVIFLSACVEGILRLFANFYLQRKFSIFFTNDRDCKAVEALDIFEKLLWLLNCCFEGIVWLFTNFYLHRISIFFKNDSDCKVVDPHFFIKKVLDIFEKQSCRNFGSHCFCKIKKPNKNFLKLKCDWWCSYFDTTDGYLRFIPTNCQTTVPFFRL